MSLMSNVSYKTKYVEKVIKSYQIKIQSKNRLLNNINFYYSDKINEINIKSERESVIKNCNKTSKESIDTKDSTDTTYATDTTNADDTTDIKEKDNYNSKIIDFENLFIKEKSSTKEIESSENIEIITEKTYEWISNLKISKPENSFINYSKILDNSNFTINKVHELVIKDVINRFKVQNGNKIENKILVNSGEENNSSENNVRDYENSNTIITKLKRLGILFDYKDVIAVNNQNNYIECINFLKTLMKDNFVKLCNKTIFWGKESSSEIKENYIECVKKIGTSCFLEIPIKIESFPILKESILIDQNCIVNEEGMNINFDFQDFIKDITEHSLLKSENIMNLNIIGFMTDPYKYIGIKVSFFKIFRQLK
jgi:hypothetical protein